MLYGPAKTRTMIRSVLPSKARRMARALKRDMHHKERSTIHNSLKTLSGSASDVIEAWEGSDFNFNYHLEPHRDRIAGVDYDIVRDRRDADKLSHFERWASKITADKAPQDKASSIRPILRSKVLGSHARSHLKFLNYDPLRPDEPQMSWRLARDKGFYRRNWSAEAEHRFDRQILDLAHRLQILDETGYRKAFNNKMKHIAAHAHTWKWNSARRCKVWALAPYKPILLLNDDYEAYIRSLRGSKNWDAAIMAIGELEA